MQRRTSGQQASSQARWAAVAALFLAAPWPASGFLPPAPLSGAPPSVAAPLTTSLGGSSSRQRVVPLTVRQAVWSNPAVTQDYFDQISGRKPPEKKDQASVIIGKGRMGQLLYSMGRGDDVLLGRGDEIPTSLVSGATGEVVESFPIYVAVQPWEVEAIIQSVGPEQRNDLVFVHPGCLENVLKRYGLVRKDTTQLLPYFHVNPFGKAIDHRHQYDVSKADGEPKWVGETSVCGKWRGAVKERLTRKDALYCKSLDWMQWRKEMLERTIFEAAFNLVGSIHTYKPVISLGDVAENHGDEVADLVRDLGKSVTKAMAVVLLALIDERLVAYGKVQAVRDRPATFPDDRLWPYTNGFFRSLSAPFRAKNMPSVCPLHDDYLEFGRETGRFNFPPDPPLV